MKNIEIAPHPTVSLMGENAPWRCPAPHPPHHRYGTGVTAICRLHHGACSPQAMLLGGRRWQEPVFPPHGHSACLFCAPPRSPCAADAWGGFLPAHSTWGTHEFRVYYAMVALAAVTNVISVEALPTAPLPLFHEGLLPARGRGFIGRSSRLTAPPRSLCAPSMSSGGGCRCLRPPDAEALPGAALPQVPDTSAAAAAAGEWQRAASRPSLPPPRTAEPAPSGAAPVLPPCAGAETVPIPGGDRSALPAERLAPSHAPVPGGVRGGCWRAVGLRAVWERQVAPCGSGRQVVPRALEAVQEVGRERHGRSAGELT